MAVRRGVCNFAALSNRSPTKITSRVIPGKRAKVKVLGISDILHPGIRTGNDLVASANEIPCEGNFDIRCIEVQLKILHIPGAG